MGATGFAYDLARQFGLKVVEPRPALVPLTLSGEDALFRDAVRRRRPKSSRAAARPAFGKRRCSPIAACRARRSCRSRRYWRRGERDRDRLPARAGRRTGCVGAKHDGPRATLALRARAPRCPTASPRRWPSGSALAGALANLPDAALREAERGSPTGASAPTAAKASPRPKSRSAASARPSCRRRPWRRGACPASTRSARRST